MNIEVSMRLANSQNVQEYYTDHFVGVKIFMIFYSDLSAWGNVNNPVA